MALNFQTRRGVQALKRTIAQIGQGNALGVAAQLAFYFFLAMFPALLFLVALTGYLPTENALSELLATLAPFTPPDVLALIRNQIEEVARGSHAGLLTVGIGAAVWSASAAMVALIDALNDAHRVAERRPWWKRRLVAIVLTITLTLFVVISLVLVLVGPDFAAEVAGWLRLEPVFAWLWALARWPVMIALIMLGVSLVYYFAPNRRTRWVWIVPGAVLATSLWIGGSFAFKFYVTNLGSYNATYGAIGSVMVLLLWFYVSGLALVVGAELNCALEESSRG